MGYELFVARRYLTAKRKQAFISVITTISILGITIGVMALVIAIALITGFQNDVQNKILDSTSHIMVSDWSGAGLSDYERIMNRIESVSGVRTTSPVVYMNVLLKGPYQPDGAVLRGIDFERETPVSPWLLELDQGRLPDPNSRRGEILLGRDLAFRIGAATGDIVTVITTPNRLSPIGLKPSTKSFVVSGIFSTGLFEFDAGTGLIDLKSAQKLFNLEDRINMIQVKIERVFEAPEIARAMREVLPEDSYVTTWMELNKPLFSALKLEKKLMFLTITLIVVVAALNIIATLILMVMEKTRDIGLLKAMGATSRDIRRIFFYQGALIGVLGTVLGTSLGLLWCWLANTFELIKVPADVYQIAFVPFRLQPLDLIVIVGVSLLISFLSTLFPSHRAAKVDPVIALKYE